jgi:hypothetical protein
MGRSTFPGTDNHRRAGEGGPFEVKRNVSKIAESYVFLSHTSLQRVSMSDPSAEVPRVTDRPVVDATGLTGH